MNKNLTSLDYAKMGCNTLMKKFTVEELPPKSKFHYHQGVFLSGMERTYLLSKEKKYYKYLKSWVDIYIDEDGNIQNCDTREFDDMQPAILLFNLYKETGDQRYKKVLDEFAITVEQWPKNAKGGFWHKYRHPNQMWLDGLYMIGPYCAMYANSFGKDYFFEIIYQQMNLMRSNITDPITGLLFHAWDDSRQTSWANKETGLSSQFWGRAIGWYAVAILDILDYIPTEHLRRDEFISSAMDILHTLIKFQDEKTGLWYQVVDKAGEPNNWLETSCSSLFTYAIAKAIKKGIIDKSYVEYMNKGYKGVIDTITFDDEENLFVNKVCVGTSIGDYDYYVKRPTVQNDLHGMGAFVLMCTEYYATNKEINNM
jgi:unsaturated rhamnogalacturonyl hydrolase